jgi:hypothetical protein
MASQATNQRDLFLDDGSNTLSEHKRSLHRQSGVWQMRCLLFVGEKSHRYDRLLNAQIPALTGQIHKLPTLVASSVS